MNGVLWSDSDIEVAKAVLGKHLQAGAEARAEISAALGRDVSVHSLANAFFRRGIGRPKEWCGRAPARAIPPPPPTAPEDIEPRVVDPFSAVDLSALDYDSDEDTVPQPRRAQTPAPPDPVAVHETRETQTRERAQIKTLIEQLRAAQSRQEFLDTANFARATPTILPRERSTTSSVREMTAVVLASDWHVEEPVDPAAVAGRNAYNLEIADARVRRFFDATAWTVEHHRADGHLLIRDLVLWLGGDLMTGYIHPELVESNLLSPTETVRWLLPRLRDGIRGLLARLDLAQIVVPCSFGNHGRTTDKPRVATGFKNSFEWLMYSCLAEEFRNEREVQFVITPSAHQYVQAYDTTIHFHHGDDVKYHGGVGGIGIPLLKAVPMWDLVRRADVHCIGHHHQFTDFGRVVVNGSLIGYGPYSQRIRAAFEPPQQAMFFVDKRRGKCMTSALWVD